MTRAADITAELRRRIASGGLRPGARVPSVRQLMRKWRVANATATKALATLQREGLVRAVPGVGTVVASPSPAGARREDPRRPGAELSREGVVATAMVLADREGLAAVSMRRIAAEMGVATMSLYRFVPGKDELVLLMAEAAFAEVALPPTAAAGWRAGLERVARAQWGLYRRHPWLAATISMTRPQLAPRAMVHTEWALAACAGLSADPTTLMHLVLSVVGYVRGMATSLESEAEDQRNSGMTADEYLTSQHAAFRAVLDSGGFPVLSGVISRGELALSLDSLFEFGLDRLLAGLAALVAGRVAGRERS